MKRELDFKMEQLNERRAELKQDTELIKQEKIEVSRQKDQLKRDEERLRAKYADFLSDTAEGRTALEGSGFFIVQNLQLFSCKANRISIG